MYLQKKTKKKKYCGKLNLKYIRVDMDKAELINRASFVMGMIKVFPVNVRDDRQRADDPQKQDGDNDKTCERFFQHAT